VTPERLGEIMLMPAGDRAWRPKHYLDLRYPWPERNLEEHGQPFNAWTFAKNATALAELAAAGPSPVIPRMAAYLDLVAGFATVGADGACPYVVNDFAYENIWTTFLPGFRGAFTNAVTAYGYVELSRATGEPAYLDTAHGLLAAAAFCETDEVRLHTVDAEGRLWLDEYVFTVPPEDVRLMEALGFIADAEGRFHARIYNGHIHALLAYIRYAQVTGSGEFDGVIAAAIETMRRALPGQIYEGRFFSYEIEFPAYPDYGPERAVLLAEGLCEIARLPDLCRTAGEMRAFFEARMRGREQAIYDAAYAEAREEVARWRAENR
jgi:hypothetical protein